MMISEEKNQVSNIPDVPEQILEASSRGRLVIFVGAGVSRIINCPSWDEFANHLLDDLNEKGEINFFEKKELFKLQARKKLSICSEIYKEKKIPPPNYREIFRGDQELDEKYKIFNNLYRMNAIYVTTNYDNHLDKEAEKRRPKLSAYFSDEKPGGKADIPIERGKVICDEKDLLISNLSNGTVIHLHGSVKDPKTMIVTLVDYMNHYYGETSKIPTFLREIFNFYTVLFIGYGLEEYEILEFMISTIRKNQNYFSHYILLPFFLSQKNIVNLQKKYYKSMGIELIPYYMDKSGPCQLAKIIEEWAKQIGPTAKPQTFLDKLRIIDEVL